MKFSTQTQTIEVEAADIPTLSKMDAEQYGNYVQSHLIFSDTHGIIRATQGEYPLATTKKQLKILIDYLEGKSELLEP